MEGFTFLTEQQIFGDSQLDILKKYGTACAITDFSILLGGQVSSDYTNEGTTGKDRIGYWWAKTRYMYGVRLVSSPLEYDRADTHENGARPALPYSSISRISSNGVRNSLGIIEVEYGEYPQTIVDEGFSRELEKNYKLGTGIRKTGKTYTTDSVVDSANDDDRFKPRKHEEFEYKGRKYIRIIGYDNINGYKLSDGRTIEFGKPYWVEVEPIKWLVDERTGIALSKKIIFAGVMFHSARRYKNFDRTDIKHFMDKYFSKEIVSDRVYTEETQTNDQQNNETLSSPNNGSFESQNESNENNGARHDIHSTSDEEVERDSASKELNAMIKEKLEAEKRIREDKKSMLHELKEYLARKNKQSSEQEESDNTNSKSK